MKMQKLLQILGGALIIGLIASGLGSWPATPGTVRAHETEAVRVTNTPLPVQGTLASSQSGQWNVSVAGTPTVNVANLPAVQLSSSAGNPLHVQDDDNPARRPFHQNQDCIFDSVASCSTVPFTVPQGKFLVIEDISGSCVFPDGMIGVLFFLNAADPSTGEKAAVTLPVTNTSAPIAPNINQTFAAFGRTSKLYISPGSSVQSGVTTTQVLHTGSVTCTVMLNGYLVNQ